MKTVYIYCEGQTEESFINKVLIPYFIQFNIFVQPIIHTTKRTNQKKFKGGVQSYGSIRSELIKLCKTHQNHAYVTTMFDYYGLPTDTPGMQESDKSIQAVESAIQDDIGEKNCMIYLNYHEFEGLLFSDPQAFDSIVEDEVVEEITKIKALYSTPEEINNSVATAPSKRLEKLIPGYAKVRNGTLLSKRMGIDVIMRECPHFAEWIGKITELPEIQ